MLQHFCRATLWCHGICYGPVYVCLCKYVCLSNKS